MNDAKLPSGGIWAGVVLMILGTVCGIVLVVAGFVQLTAKLDQTVTMGVPGKQTFTFEPDEYLVYASDSATTIGDVQVTDPNGQKVALSPVGGLQTFTRGNISHVGFAKFTVPSKGTYTVEVTDPTASTHALHPAAQVAIGQGAVGLVGTTLLLVFGGFGLGGIVFLIGLAVMIVGLVRRSRAKRAMRPAYQQPVYQRPPY